MKQPGHLTLIPTPLDDEAPLSSVALKLLLHAFSEENRPHSVMLVEELKVARKKWGSWGLPREMYDAFVAFNEHTYRELESDLMLALKAGKNLYLMSDGGLPAFFDPGQSLVNQCHHQGIRVTSAPFDNSVVLALALSGFSHKQFLCAGFLPSKGEERAKALSNYYKRPETLILMDTPYRLKQLLQEVKEEQKKTGKKRRAFLGLDLNRSTEQLIRGDLVGIIDQLPQKKMEFILVLE